MSHDPAGAADASQPRDDFNIPLWHEGCEVWLGFAGQYWRRLVHLRRKADFVPPSSDDPEGVDIPYDRLVGSDGRSLPPVVRAAAGLRSALIYLLEKLLPETGVSSYGEDEVERRMAAGASWVEALRLALDDIDRLKVMVGGARPGWGVTTATDVPALLNLLERETDRQVRQFEALSRPRLARLSEDPLQRAGYTRIPADRINKAVIEALSPGALREPPAGFFKIFAPGVQFALAYAFGTGRRAPGYDQLVGVVGLREEPDDDQLMLLRRGAPLAVKIHLALWERAYVEAGGGGTYATRTTPRPCDYVTTTVARLCDDVGLSRKKGAHKRESRESVVGLLKLLTSLELVCLYRPPRNVPAERLRGPIWKRGIVPEGLARGGDVFVADGGGGSAKQTFSYAPGPYYENSVWRGHNRYVAQVHAGLLGLNCRNEHRWDVALGAYLSVLARMNGYRKLTLRRRTLVESTGLREVYGGKHSSRMRDALDESLDRLIDLGLLRRWCVKEGTEEPVTDSWRWAEEWLEARLEFEWPEEIKTRSRLLHRRKQAKLAKKRWEPPIIDPPT